jgi:hypothetical protein
MKKHLIFLTFIFSLISFVNSCISGDIMAILGWMTATFASIDHFMTLRNLK